LLFFSLFNIYIYKGCIYVYKEKKKKTEGVGKKTGEHKKEKERKVKKVGEIIN